MLLLFFSYTFYSLYCLGSIWTELKDALSVETVQESSSKDLAKIMVFVSTCEASYMHPQEGVPREQYFEVESKRLKKDCSVFYHWPPAVLKTASDPATTHSTNSLIVGLVSDPLFLKGGIFSLISTGVHEIPEKYRGCQKNT